MKRIKISPLLYHFNTAQNKGQQYVRMHALLIAIVQQKKKMCHNCAFTFITNKRRNLIEKIYLI